MVTDPIYTSALCFVKQKRLGRLERGGLFFFMIICALEREMPHGTWYGSPVVKKALAASVANAR
jgi:hypothetical protein